MIKRKPLPKKLRLLVYEKCDGHCGYCGCELEYKDMQVDHINSLLRNRCMGEDVIQDDSLDNLMPACRQCNYYKSAMNIESFRKEIKKTLSKTCRESFVVKLAMKYGMMEYKDWDGKFYFEKHIKENENDSI